MLPATNEIAGRRRFSLSFFSFFFSFFPSHFFFFFLRNEERPARTVKSQKKISATCLATRCTGGTTTRGLKMKFNTSEESEQETRRGRGACDWRTLSRNEIFHATRNSEASALNTRYLL
ncbi:hypothetical protein PUN28_018308 [Cardiocondyla obscurior]|uniref:Secreted protein n=1 Tax=Cardiocondyla obscurior TaxID=286306 RepID=A0AAW2EJ33_9HYME